MPYELYDDLKEAISKFHGWKVTKDEGQYFQADNGKKFISFNCDCKEYAHLGVRDDGNTRTSFNGVVYSVSDLRTILSLIR